MKLHFQASKLPTARSAFAALTNKYGQTETPAEADVIVSLGGDGQTLRALQDGIHFRKPVFGLNFGHVGFFQNLHDEGQDLIERITKAEPLILSPLHIEARFMDGTIRHTFAINEVHVCNHNRAEGIYLRVSIDNMERVPRLGADGLIISTTAGSTGYNKSARGPIMPLGDDMIAFTPNNAFTPDRMRASVIRPRPIHIDVIDAAYRQADVYSDSDLVGESSISIDVKLDPEHAYTLLFDKGYSLHEKIMRTQFGPTPSI